MHVCREYPLRIRSMNILRVLQVCHRFYPEIGGAESHVRNLSRSLSKLGVDVTVFTTDRTHKLPKLQLIGGVRIWRFPSYGFYYFSLQLLKALARVQGYDVIHVHAYQAFPTLATAVMRDINRTPLVMTTHLAFPRIGRFPHLIYSKIGNYIIKKSDVVIVNSEREEQALSSLGIYTQGKVVHIPVDVDEQFYEIQRNDIKKRILYSGRLEHYKGVHTLIRALSLLPDNDVELNVVGDGSYKRKLQTLTTALNLSSKVKFLGRLSDKRLLELFSQSDLFVLPSKYESLGMAMLEAMASGMPVISTPPALASLQGILHARPVNQKIAILVRDFTKPEALAESIQLLLRDKRLAREIADNAREAVRDFSSSNVCKRILKVYRDLMD